MTIEIRDTGDFLPAREQGSMLATSETSIPWMDGAGVEHWDPVERAEVQAKVDYVARQIASWVKTTRGAAKPSIFNRQAYIAPDNHYSQFILARNSVENDDIVGGVADVTEALSFQGVKWESPEAKDADLFNQMARDLNVDQFVRQWHREDYTYSQAVIAMWWGFKDYKDRSKTEGGKKSKRKRTVYCPVAFTYLDPMRVFPLPPGPFGQERLAWHASDSEHADLVAAGGDVRYLQDAVLREFLIGPANITSQSERAYVAECGMDYRKLYLLNPERVSRLSRTKMPYERFSQIRLRSVFPLLDLKQHLIDADRVNLIGAANFILLVKQGSDTLPASQDEVDNLKANFNVVAKLPVVVGDHRLNIEIITPEQEHVLSSAKYDTLDRRILNRVLGALSIGGSGQRNESTVTVARGVARLLENRRHMLKRWMEEHVARAVVEHPFNADKFDDEPNLTFTPRNVQLDADAEVSRAIMQLRTQNDLSRESALEYYGFDQAVEAMRREFEEENYDDIFKTEVPFSAGGSGDGEDPVDPRTAGQQGGRPPGGGDSRKSPQGSAGGRTSTGNKSTSK